MTSKLRFILYSNICSCMMHLQFIRKKKEEMQVIQTYCAIKKYKANECKDFKQIR